MRSWRGTWLSVVLVSLLMAGCAGGRATPTAVPIRPTLTPEPGPPRQVTLVPSATPQQATPEGGSAEAVAAIRTFMLDPGLELSYAGIRTHPENGSMAVEQYDSADHTFLVEIASGRVVYMHVSAQDWAPAAEPVVAPEELARRAYQIAVARCSCFTEMEHKLEYKPGGKGANLFFRWQLPAGDPSRPLDQPTLLQVGLASDGTLFEYIDSGICHIPADTPDFLPPTPLPSETSAEPTPLPLTPEEPTPVGPVSYEGWQTYQNAKYGFVLRYPTGWQIEEVTENSTLAGHAVRLWPSTPAQIQMIIAFRSAGEGQFIGRTGVGAGELVERGEVIFMGEPVSRVVLVAQERAMSVLYAGGRVIGRGDLAFTLFLDYFGDPNGGGLSEEEQTLADQIVASLTLE